MEVACTVFSNKGFREATHEMICGQAGVNKAAISHHFGGKKSLYRAVWQHLLDAADREHPVSGNLCENATAIERLETHVRSLLSRHHGEGTSRQLARLRDLERVNPTGLVDDVRRAHHDRNRRQMLSVLTELLGDEASRSAIEFYETSVLALARAGWSQSAPPGADGWESPPIGARKINTLARQITQFLLAGIETNVHETPKT
jgi:AcrR family transcriptional regulator